MAPSPSRALTKRSAETALMPPPSTRPKRIKRPAVVLDEDTYTDGLSHIIARDFFPGLLESETQREYLDAVESRDRGWMREAGAKLAQVMTPRPDGSRRTGRRGVSMTPMRESGSETPRLWGGATPASVSEASSTAATPVVDLDMSLSSFQAKYTSEDNESFNALLDKQNVKRAEKYAWLYDGTNKIPSGRQIAYREREQRLLKASEAQRAEEARHGEAPHVGNELVRRPTHPDDRPAMPDIRRGEARNAFMFGPDSIEDTLPTRAQAAEAASNAPPKQIKHDNTRLQSSTATEGGATIPPSPSMSAVDAAIAGRPRGTESEPGSYDGSETPRVNGYAFVDEEPTSRELGRAVSPSSADEDEQRHLLALLTEGASSEGGPSPFRLAASSKRESLHHAMVEKTAKEKRAGTRLDALKDGRPGDAGGRTATPKFLSATPRVREGGLTPAARALLGRVGTPVRGEVVSSVFDGKTRGTEERWTPKVALTPRKDV